MFCNKDRYIIHSEVSQRRVAAVKTNGQRQLPARELRDISKALVTITRRGSSQASHRARLEEAGVQLSFPGAHLLDECCRRGPSRVTDLSDALQMPVPLISREANRLLADGYLARGSDPADGRTTVLRPTAKGREILERYQRVVDRQLRTIFSSWDPADVSHFLEFLDRFNAELAP